MPFVVDSSITACWLLPDEDHPHAGCAWDYLKHDNAIAPQLWWFEVRNMLIINERRGRIDASETVRGLALLAGLPVVLDTVLENEPVLQLARHYRLTVYDAVYLELAMRKDLPLATLDVTLANAARGERISLIGE